MFFSLRILDEKYLTLYDTFKTIYADILHRWNLLDARVQVTSEFFLY